MFAAYLSADEFASAAGMAGRTARRALERAAAGKHWNRHLLEVREVPSRGGRAGVRYEVAVASLPSEIAAKVSPQAPARPRPAAGKDWRLQLALRVVQAGPPGSPARAAALREVAAMAVRPCGANAGAPVPERTLRAWVATYEARGVLPLAGQARRKDRGQRRVVAWRVWDRAMDAAGVPAGRQRDMAATLRAEVMGLWKAGEASAANIAFSMGPRCRDLAEGAGVRLPEPDMAALCRMPLHFAGHKKLRRARVAHVKATDAARWHANHVPRVRRHREGMRPMDQVAADVRHSDILYRRDDGSLATVKMVCFLDLATNRLFARTFVLPKGEMIRREHVLVALRDLAADPAWGLWRCLYMDNGGEFSLGAAADDLAHLVDLARRVAGEDGATRCGTVRSLPHNPQSKVIEGVFSAFTRSIEPVYPGFIGGNRMAKKSANQGREPAPLPGGEAEILAAYAEMVAVWNAKPQQRGAIAGRSPNEAFAAFASDAANPWRGIVLPEAEFALAFGPEMMRVVQPGGELHIAKRAFVHSGLAAMVGEAVRVRVPILSPECAVVLADNGEPLLIAREAEVFAFQDRAGAKAHRTGRRAAAQAAKQAAAGAGRMNPIAARKRAVAALPAPAAPTPIGAATLHPVLRAAVAEAPPPAPLRPRREAARAASFDKQAAALAEYTAALRRAG